MLQLPTFSGWDRAMACEGSVVLPQHHDDDGAWSEEGRAVHRFLHRASVVGRDAALLEVEGKYVGLCEEIDLSRLPLGPDFIPEQALALDLAHGRARVLKVDDRNYGLLSEWETAGTPDVSGVLPDGRAYVSDFKRDWGSLRASRYLWQLRAGAAAWSLVVDPSGMTDAVVAIITIGSDGETSEPMVAEWDCFQLQDFRKQMLARAKVLRAATAASAAVHSGDHCRHCHAFKGCPEKTALIRAVTTEPAAIVERFHALMEQQPSNALRMYRDASKVLDVLGEELKTYAVTHPFETEDGYMYGQVEEQHVVFDAEKAFEVLTMQMGGEFARKVVRAESSKNALKEAIKELRDQKKAAGESLNMAKMERELLEAVGARTVPVTKVKEFKRKTA